MRSRAKHEGNKSHNHELKADKRLIFTLARIPQGMQKYTEEKCLHCSSFFCFSTLHAGIGGIHKFIGFLIMLVFLSRISNKLFVLFVVNARSRLAMLSYSESELFVTQSSFSGNTSTELSENNFESLFSGANNEKAVDNFNLCTQDLLTDPFTDKEDSGRGITTVSYKGIQARNEARIPQNTKRATSWSKRVWDDWVTERNSLPINGTYWTSYCEITLHRRAKGNCVRCFARISN